MKHHSEHIKPDELLQHSQNFLEFYEQLLSSILFSGLNIDTSTSHLLENTLNLLEQIKLHSAAITLRSTHNDERNRIQIPKGLHPGFSLNTTLKKGQHNLDHLLVTGNGPFSHDGSVLTEKNINFSVAFLHNRMGHPFSTINIGFLPDQRISFNWGTYFRNNVISRFRESYTLNPKMAAFSELNAELRENLTLLTSQVPFSPEELATMQEHEPQTRNPEYRRQSPPRHR